MMNILEEIVAKTKSKLEEKKQRVSLEELSSKIAVSYTHLTLPTIYSV